MENVEEVGYADRLLNIDETRLVLDSVTNKRDATFLKTKPEIA